MNATPWAVRPLQTRPALLLALLLALLVTVFVVPTEGAHASEFPAGPLQPIETGYLVNGNVVFQQGPEACADCS